MDYRTSHLGKEKAHSYHTQFSKNPYRRMIWELERSVLDSIVAKHFPDRIPAYLDFACGSGRVAKHLLPHVEHGVGVDISTEMVAIARAEVPGCEFVVADLTAENALEDRQFDLVTAFRFFPNAQDSLRRAGMSAIVALMKPGALLVFNNHKTTSSLLYRLGALVRGERQHSWPTKEVEDLMRSFGLEIVERHHLGVIPATDKYHPPIAALRPLERALSRLSPLRSLAYNHIYVVRKAA